MSFEIISHANFRIFVKCVCETSSSLQYFLFTKMISIIIPGPPITRKVALHSKASTFNLKCDVLFLFATANQYVSEVIGPIEKCN